MSSLLSCLFSSTLFLAVGGGIVFLLLRLFGSRSSFTHRTAWGAVLLLGVLWFQVPLEIPVLMTPQPIQQQEEEASPIVFVPESFEAPPAQEPVVSAPGFVEPRQAVAHQDVTAGTPSPVLVKKPPFRRTFDHALHVLFGIWVAGMVGFACRGFIAWLRVLRQLRETAAPEGIFETEWKSLLVERGISPQRVRLAMSGHTGPGLVRSLRNYTVVVPRLLWEEADATVRRGILKHELSHYVHGDLATSFGLRLIALIHWFNPVAGFAVRRFEDATEWRCDAEAFGRYENGVSDFARALLAFRDTVPVTATYRRDFCGNNIVDRARRLVDVHQNLGDSIMKKTAIFCCVLLLLCGALFRIQLVAQTPPQKEPGMERTREIPGPAPKPVKDVQWVEIRGKVVAPNDEPMDAIKLMAIGLSDQGQCSENVTCDKNGDFKMDAFPNNDYCIAVFDEKGRFTAPDYETPIGTESPKDPITITLEKGTPFELKFIDETTGKPIPGLRINLLREVRTKTTPTRRGTIVFGKTTDDEGKFTANLMPGEYTFGVDYLFFDSKSLADGVYAREVVVEKEKPFSLEVRIPTPFTGKVLRTDGSPAAGCYVYSPGNRLVTVTTDKNGIFRTVRSFENTSVTITPPDKTEQYFGFVGKELKPLKEFTFQLVKPVVLKGRLLDAATKEPLPERMICYWKMHPTDPTLEEWLPGMTKTDKEGRFVLKTLPSLKYDIFVVLGRDSIYNGGPYYPRINLAALETTSDKDLGDLLVDETKAVDDPDAEQTEKSVRLSEQVISGKKKSALKICVKKSAEESLGYLLKHQHEEPFASFALQIYKYDELSDSLREKLDREIPDAQKEEPLLMLNDSIQLKNPPEFVTFSQLRGEAESAWNVPKDDPSTNGDWKKSPGMINPKILDNFLRDMLRKAEPSDAKPKDRADISDEKPVGKLDPKEVRIKGKVFLPDGSSAKGMQIMVTGRSRVGEGGGTASTFVKDDGSFVRANFTNAEYMISLFDPQGKWSAPSQFITVKDEAEYAEEIVFKPEEGIRVIGKVVDETTDKPIPNIELSVSYYNDKTVDGVHAFFKIQADENGDYAFAAPPSEDVYVNVGSQPIYREWHSMTNIDRERYEKTMKKVPFDGQPIINIDFRIPTPFVGKVLLPGGSPASGASVQVLSYRPRHAEATMRGNFVETDKNGYFRLTERPKYVFCSIWANHQYIFTGWFDDDLPKEGEMVFQLQRACSIKGRLIDSATKKPLANQLFFLERSSVTEPRRFDYMPLGFTKTDQEGYFNTKVFIAAGVRYELFVVPGRQMGYGGVPTDKRVTLATVIPEKPGDRVDLGNVDVDMAKAVEQTDSKENPKDEWRIKLFKELADKVRNGDKKSMMKIYFKPEAKAAADYFEQHQNEEPIASFALYIVPYEKLSEDVKKQQDEWSDKIDAGSFCIANDPITSSKPVGVMTLSQLRGEKDSKWNVPENDPSRNGDWKKTPGMLNPAILKRFLQDMLTGEITAADMTERALRVQPLGDNVDCDRPTPEEAKRCTFKQTDDKKGFVVTNSQGKILRKFLDTTGDGRVDQWSYFKDGVEVWRDCDTDSDGIADRSGKPETD